jgi:hypothetical protein
VISVASQNTPDIAGQRRGMTPNPDLEALFDYLVDAHCIDSGTSSPSALS